MRKNIFDWIYSTVLIGLIAWGLYLYVSLFASFLTNSYKNYENNISEVEELGKKQDELIGKFNTFTFNQLQLDGIIISILNQEVKKPNYDYLRSVSVYIMQTTELPDGKEAISVGSGTIIAYKNGFTYILTNRHVCNYTDIGNCFVIAEGEEDPIELEFIKNTDVNSDLALWRYDGKIKGKKVIKGFSNSSYQTRVFSVGHYLGIPYTYTEGTKANQISDNDVYNLPCAPGCSGSGIFDSDGNLVSVVSAVYTMTVVNFPIARSLDTSKVIGVKMEKIQYFLRELFESERN